jgi:hypothetical protein
MIRLAFIVALAFVAGLSCASRTARVSAPTPEASTRPAVRDGLPRQRFTIVGYAKDGTELGRLPFGEAIRDGRIVSIDSQSGDTLTLPANWVLNHLVRSGDTELQRQR